MYGPPAIRYLESSCLPHLTSVTFMLLKIKLLILVFDFYNLFPEYSGGPPKIVLGLGVYIFWSADPDIQFILTILST